MDTGSSRTRFILEQVDSIDSTNSELLRREPLLPPGSREEAVLLVAAHQTSGRGRRQRRWVSTPAGSLTASFAREVRRPSQLGALSLVSGLALAQTLATFGVTVRLKWPNDLYAFGGKAGGVLCEARARGGSTRLVIGFGLNLLPPTLDAAADAGWPRDGVEQPAAGRGRSDAVTQPVHGPEQPVAGLFDGDALPDRRRLAEAIGGSLLDATDRLLAHGFEPFREAWSAHDMLLFRPITIHDGERTADAVAVGVDADGALLVQVAGGQGLKRLLAEEVSVRPQ